MDIFPYDHGKGRPFIKWSSLVLEFKVWQENDGIFKMCSKRQFTDNTIYKGLNRIKEQQGEMLE